jgi:LysM repeat protein
VDTATLTMQRAPFLASENTGEASLGSAERADVLFGEGAVRDPEAVVEAKTSAPANIARQALESGVIYQVAAGDTLQTIAIAFGVPKNKIVQFNPSVNFSPLNPGVSIVIPGEKDINFFSAQS